MIHNEQISTSVFSDIAEIRDIVASANMGIWRIEMVTGKEPCMYVDETMKRLLGISGQERTPEKTYTDWYSNIKPDAVESVLNSVERMKQGFFDENTYKWIHPTKGERYVRCGGTAQAIEGGFSLRGYHYDVDEVIRKEQAQQNELREAVQDKDEYYTALGTLESIFYSMHLIDLVNDTVTEFNSRDEVKAIVNHKHGAAEMMVQVMSVVIDDEYKEEALAFTDLTTIADRMKDKKVLSNAFIGKRTGWFIASFVTMNADEQGRPTKVIYTTRVIEEEKKQEEQLIEKSHTDELTGLLNRRAYEEDVQELGSIPGTEKFTYISLDVNGLKVINDTMGHMAGDELIIGACQCMKKIFSIYGKIYRVGGDEFVAILSCSSQQIKELLADFDQATSNWSGELINGISISYGWINKEERPELSVRQLGIIAEQRMYDSKAAFYRKSGVDRSGQQAAHKALCNLYTKILKINTLEDSYHIINMNVAEQTNESGFSDKISTWLKSFGENGYVHPDDLKEYLTKTDLTYIEDYFASGKTSLHIFYRRRYGDVFKQVMMEIIPANDYADDNHSYFMYVKDIDN